MNRAANVLNSAFETGKTMANELVNTARTDDDVAPPPGPPPSTPDDRVVAGARDEGSRRIGREALMATRARAGREPRAATDDSPPWARRARARSAR